MEILEKINRTFGGWYEGLFGTSDDVRPKDVLRRILTTLEENRKEGFDSKVYVPNQYILEISVADPEEKEYLLSFLDRDELETVIRRYCQQNNFHIRGSLDFTIKEVEFNEAEPAEKVRVRCRYDSRLAAIKENTPAIEATPEEKREIEAVVQTFQMEPEEDATVSAVRYEDEDEGTVPAIGLATLDIQFADGKTSAISLTPKPFTIGRSAKLGNDLVVPDDGLISRRHARIEYEADGQFTLYDVQTTNGTKVNGRTIDNTALKNGDEIVIGSVKIIFRQSADAAPVVAVKPAPVASGVGTPTLVLTDGSNDLKRFILGADSVVGRGITNDVVLDDRSIATRHVRFTVGDDASIEVLAADHLTLLNGTPLESGDSRTIQPGDRIGIGTQTLRFERSVA
ncbi:MAG: FhaA domain-containing protein [Chthonomonadales bacterium]